MDSATKSREDLRCALFGHFLSLHGFKTGGAHGQGCHCTYLGFIIIATGDCRKALDEIPEEREMRSTENGKQTDNDWVGHAE
jgi:hypothetical protein